MPSPTRITTAPRVDEAIAALASKQLGLITWEQALSAGATPSMIQHRLDTGRWRRMHRGVYRLAGLPGSMLQNLKAVTLACQWAVASHRAAGGLWQFPDFRPQLEITVPRAHRFRHPEIIVHRTIDLPGADITRVQGIPVTSPARTLIDLGAVVSTDVVEEALDDALRRNLVTLRRLSWKLRDPATSKRPGSAAIRSILADRNTDKAPTGSVLETRILRMFRAKGLPEPTRQHQIWEKGRLRAVIDFAYPDHQVAIEVDGLRHHSGRIQWERDLARQNYLSSLGWRVFRVTFSDLVAGGKDVCAAITSVLSLLEGSWVSYHE